MSPRWFTVPAAEPAGDGWQALSLLADELAATSQAIGEITGGGHRPAIQRERLIARLGALRAAIDFTVARNALGWDAVNQQRDRQRAHYEALHAQRVRPVPTCSNSSRPDSTAAPSLRLPRRSAHGASEERV